MKSTELQTLSAVTFAAHACPRVKNEVKIQQLNRRILLNTQNWLQNLATQIFIPVAKILKRHKR